MLCSAPPRRLAGCDDVVAGCGWGRAGGPARVANARGRRCGRPASAVRSSSTGLPILGWGKVWGALVAAGPPACERASSLGRAFCSRATPARPSQWHIGRQRGRCLFTSVWRLVLFDGRGPLSRRAFARRACARASFLNPSLAGTTRRVRHQPKGPRKNERERRARRCGGGHHPVGVSFNQTELRSHLVTFQGKKKKATRGSRMWLAGLPQWASSPRALCGGRTKMARQGELGELGGSLAREICFLLFI